MKHLLLYLVITSSLFAWDCSANKKDSTLTTDAFCRNYTTTVTLFNYDRFSITTGMRIATEKDAEPLLELILEEANQCYQTCLMANMY